MSRIMKFRLWAETDEGERMIYLEEEKCDNGLWFIPPCHIDGYISVMQFTGHQIAGVDLYEGDIVRVEEDANGVDPADRMNWYVVTWIKEWCMFALLRVGGEYQEYIDEGTDGLDTSMFWTFPLDVEDIGFSKHFLCGNIYENENLLNNGK